MAEQKQTAPVAPQGAPAPKFPQYILDAAHKLGKSPEDTVKLFGTFTNQQARGQKVGKAITAAMTQLKKENQARYKEILREQYVLQKLDPSTIKD